VVQLPAAAGSASSAGLWAYLVIFALVAVGWAGVPAIGGAVIAGAAVAASRGSLSFGGVLVASVLGTGVGGLAGYSIGLRWGACPPDTSWPLARPQGAGHRRR
jgi:membrane protein DedA with SNARE-associated domain